MIQIALTQYGQIIADHSVVDRYDDIPQQYINEVKKMLLVVPGESHSNAYFEGLLWVEESNPAYQVEWSSTGAPQGYTESYLRATRATWGDYENTSGWIHLYGEGDWFTNVTAIARTKAGISYCHANDLTVSAMGFGWCYDQIAGPNTIGTDPVYGVHWAGLSEYGPDGDKAWGIDADDFAVTGNSVCMDTYISATQEYIDHCTANNIPTKVFFTTGPVDDHSSEDHYQGYLKHERIRDYVKADPSRILFDYADILCYDDDGSMTTDSWNDNTFPAITSTNLIPKATGHISKAGAVRLGKAMWWMLARIAGWEVTGSSFRGTEPEDSAELEVIFDANSDQIMVSSSAEYRNGRIELYDMRGCLMGTRAVTDDVTYLNASHLSGGVYLVVLSNELSREVKKFALIQ